jgi:hypothetical protein
MVEGVSLARRMWKPSWQNGNKLGSCEPNLVAVYASGQLLSCELSFRQSNVTRETEHSITWNNYLVWQTVHDWPKLRLTNSTVCLTRISE